MLICWARLPVCYRCLMCSMAHLLATYMYVTLAGKTLRTPYPSCVLPIHVSKCSMFMLLLGIGHLFGTSPSRAIIVLLVTLPLKINNKEVIASPPTRRQNNEALANKRQGSKQQQSRHCLASVTCLSRTLILVLIPIAWTSSSTRCGFNMQVPSAALKKHLDVPPSLRSFTGWLGRL